MSIDLPAAIVRTARCASVVGRPTWFSSATFGKNPKTVCIV